ncbi:MAG: alkaline phosphatase family protein [Peptococcaceae bacterium]|nr:alkaline phosphatase family protein [Peptococcaceae bacterium]
MIKKLIVIGIDGMDFDIVMKYEKDLPHISAMLSDNGYPHLRSVFPADTTPAWATIFTGLDPSEHGIINFVNVCDKENKYKPISFDDCAFRGKTFWDELNRKGYSCAVLLPMNIKHGWEINGLFISRPYEGNMSVFPKTKTMLYTPDSRILGNEGKFISERQLDRLKEEFFEKAAEEFRLTKRAIQNEDCDMLFSYFSTVDGVQHDFWRYCDEKHPEYPGETKYCDVIRDTYKLIDKYIGEIIKLCPETPILVISDHGHGARPVYTARINEMLRREGYLAPRTSGSDSQAKLFHIKKWVKKGSLHFVKKFGLPKWAVKLAKMIPVWKSIFVSSTDFDWDKTVAYLSDLSALKNYSYGGIRIADKVEDKEKLCDEIVEKLEAVLIEDEKTPAFKWIRRIDTLYRGQYLDRYPEIIFQLDEHYGADWNLGEKLFEKQGFMHKLSPGSHRYETAVIASKGFKLEKEQYEMTDIYKIITRQFGVWDKYEQKSDHSFPEQFL